MESNVPLKGGVTGNYKCRRWYFLGDIELKNLGKFSILIFCYFLAYTCCDLWRFLGAAVVISVVASE